MPIMGVRPRLVSTDRLGRAPPPIGSAETVLGEDPIMLKLAVVVWIILGVTVAGAALTVVLAVPSLSQNAMRLLPIAALVGFVVAIPLSVLVARRIDGQTRRP
jgi:hypothetical protein